MELLAKPPKVGRERLSLASAQQRYFTTKEIQRSRTCLLSLRFLRSKYRTVLCRKPKPQRIASRSSIAFVSDITEELAWHFAAVRVRLEEHAKARIEMGPENLFAGVLRRFVR